MKTHLTRLVIIAFSLVSSIQLTNVANAQQQPAKLELGISAVALTAPDYRGSKKSNSYFFPAPYIKYRGEHIRIDDGIQAVFIDSPNLFLSLSGNISPAVDEDTPERQGMDELKAVLELGPSLEYRFNNTDKSSWWVELPLRFAYTVDSDLDDLGHILHPRISWRQKAKSAEDWKLNANIGLLFSSAKQHDYYYSVDVHETLSTRPEFKATGGFSGTRLEASFSKRVDSFWLGGFIRYDNLNHSKIEASPLVSDTDSWFSGVAIAWIFYQQ